MTEHTLTLSDSQTIVEALARAGNNIKMGLSDTETILVEMNSDKFIFRAGYIAFIRSHIY